MLDAEGNEVFRSEEFALSSGSLDSDDIEILREDLVDIVNAENDGVEYLFGDSDHRDPPGTDGVTGGEVAGQGVAGGGVTVEFERAAPRRFDLVVGADGLHSNTRRLVFGPEKQYLDHLGIYLGVFSQENHLGLDKWQTWFNNGVIGGAVMTVRDNTELRVYLGFGSEPIDYDYRRHPGPEAAHRRPRDRPRLGGPRLHRAHVEGRRLLLRRHGPDPDGRLVRRAAWRSSATPPTAPRPPRGRAPASPSSAPTSSPSNSAAPSDHEPAFARYEQRMRPFVEVNQALALLDPKTTPPEVRTARTDEAKNAIDLDAVID